MLHGPDVLESLLADSEDPRVRSWAATRLAHEGPDRLRGRLPDDADAMVLCALRAPVLPAVLARTAAGEPVAARALLRIGRLGGWPADLAPVVDAATRGVAGAPVPCASVLLGAGRPSVAAMRALAEGDPAERAVAGATALAIAARTGDLEDTARAVAAEVTHPQLTDLVLSLLGARAFGEAIDPEEAAEFGFLCGGGQLRQRPPKGSERRRCQAWIRQLLADHPGPAAAFLRARAEGDVIADDVASAAWLACPYQPATPVDAVLRRGVEDPPTLAAAVGAHAVEAIREAVPVTPNRLGAAILALGALRRGVGPEEADDLVSGVIDAAIAEDLGVEATVLAAAACSHDAGRVAGLLSDPMTRRLGIRVAPYVLDEDALAVLVGVPYPIEHELRVRLAVALASTGDAAAAAPLRDLYAADDALPTGPKELYEALLGAPLDAI